MCSAVQKLWYLLLFTYSSHSLHAPFYPCLWPFLQKMSFANDDRWLLLFDCCCRRCSVVSGIMRYFLGFLLSVLRLPSPGEENEVRRQRRPLFYSLLATHFTIYLQNKEKYFKKTRILFSFRLKNAIIILKGFSGVFVYHNSCSGYLVFLNYFPSP